MHVVFETSGFDVYDMTWDEYRRIALYEFSLDLPQLSEVVDDA